MSETIFEIAGRITFPAEERRKKQGAAGRSIFRLNPSLAMARIPSTPEIQRPSLEDQAPSV
jgi:hypothetical protein